MVYQIDTGYACAGIETDSTGIVIIAAPIFRWMIGKHIEQIKQWKKIKTMNEIT